MKKSFLGLSSGGSRPESKSEIGSGAEDVDAVTEMGLKKMGGRGRGTEAQGKRRMREGKSVGG